MDSCKIYDQSLLNKIFRVFSVSSTFNFEETSSLRDFSFEIWILDLDLKKQTEKIKYR